MNCYPAPFSKDRRAQLKIQEMAFVLIALMILFVMVALFYLAFSLDKLKYNVAEESQAEALALVRKLASTPEFSWTRDSTCTACLDFDKALMLKERKSYGKFWNLDYLAIEVVGINASLPARECTRANYPDCTILTLKNSTQIGTPVGSFVVLCRRDFTGRGFVRCDLGKLFASGKGVFNEKN